MSDTKISALPSAGGLTGSEPVAIVQSSTTKQTTTQDIADLAVTGNTNIELITNAAILVKEAGSLLDLNTLYQITDATPYVMQVQADAVNAIGKSAIIIDATYGGSGYYDATTDAFKGNIYDVDSNVFNLTLPSDITLGSSTALNNFIGCGANVLGDSCRRNTFMQGTNGWTFGNSLSEVTIYAASGTSGLDCTNLTNFGFLYSNAYPAEIKYDSTNWYHYYNDPANDRIVQTLMAAPYTVTYIGGGMSNPMTTGGDIIYGGASGVATRLANGSAGQVLQSNGTTLAPSWAAAPSGGSFVETLVSGATPVTGTTANTYSAGVLVPAGTFVADDCPFVILRINKTGTNNTVTMRVYANTVNSISGTPILIGTWGAIPSTNRTFGMSRTMAIVTADGTGSGTTVISATTALQFDEANSTAAQSSLAIDWTVDQYIVVAIQNTSAGDSCTVTMLKVRQS
jgi:hypothetical protein